MLNNIKSQLLNWSEQLFEEYGLIIVTLVVGIMIGWYTKFLFADRKYVKQMQLRLDEKNDHIAQLSFIVHERLNDVKVEKKDKEFFKRLRKYFNKNFKIGSE